MARVARAQHGSKHGLCQQVKGVAPQPGSMGRTWHIPVHAMALQISLFMSPAFFTVPGKCGKPSLVEATVAPLQRRRPPSMWQRRNLQLPSPAHSTFSVRTNPDLRVPNARDACRSWCVATRSLVCLQVCGQCLHEAPRFARSSIILPLLQHSSFPQSVLLSPAVPATRKP